MNVENFTPEQAKLLYLLTMIGTAYGADRPDQMYKLNSELTRFTRTHTPTEIEAKAIWDFTGALAVRAGYEVNEKGVAIIP